MKPQEAKFISFLCIAVMATACNYQGNDKNSEDPLLAQVQNKMLHLSELEGMVPEGSSSEDSALIINSFVERWVREAVLLNEAELNVPKDLNIDKLVRDYRASLIKNNYEQILVDQLLDSLVTQETLHSYYEKNKEQFQLDEPIIRAYFMKIPLIAGDLKEVRKWWNNIDEPENMESLRAYCQDYSTSVKLERETWYNLKEITAEMPGEWISSANLSARQGFIRDDENFRYFYKPLDIIQAKSTAPFEHVEGKIKRLILHQRKQKLLEQKKEEMYERELRRNNIKIYRQ